VDLEAESGNAAGYSGAERWYLHAVQRCVELGGQLRSLKLSNEVAVATADSDMLVLYSYLVVGPLTMYGLAKWILVEK